MSLFKKHFDAMSLYSPPLEGRDKGGRLLLDFNERTVPVGLAIEDAMVGYIRAGKMQMYPSYGDITERIADYVGVDADKLMITNGSDQGIDLLFRAACSAGEEVIIPGPSFPMYIQAAQVELAHIHSPDYTAEGGYPLQAVIDCVNDKTRVIVVSNPNNPSGTLLSEEGVIRLAEAAPDAVILVDECYYEYCGLSVVGLIDRFTNIVVVRTFSKTWGLPSLRIGYAVAAPVHIETLLKVRGPYDINQLAVVAVAAALDNQESIHSYIREVMELSKPKLETFLNQENVFFWPSVANFLWVFFDDAEAVELALRTEDILVRPKSDANGRLGLRITLGTEAQVDRLIGVLAKAL
ncbi:MAG: histidinol-phosphate aminotransferase [Flavobacteriales bacterium]|jgi:histidinol-phosphate aminotransferase